eukprot:4925801-Pyramimonas_sp.AAC.1
MVSVPGIVFWEDSGLGGRNSYVDLWRSCAIQERQGAIVRVIRGVAIQRMMLSHASWSSNGCLQMNQFPQWN